MSKRVNKGFDNIESWTVKEIRSELSKRKIRATSSTKKAELVELLKEDVKKEKKKKAKKNKESSSDSSGKEDKKKVEIVKGKKQTKNKKEKKDTNEDEKSMETENISVKKKGNKKTKEKKESTSKPPLKKDKDSENKKEKTSKVDKSKKTSKLEKEPENQKSISEESDHGISSEEKIIKTESSEYHIDTIEQSPRSLDSDKISPEKKFPQNSPKSSSHTDKNTLTNKNSMDSMISTDSLDDLIATESEIILPNKRKYSEDIENQLEKGEEIDHMTKKKRTQEPEISPAEQHNANRVVPESPVPPTSTLYIKNFVRPFHHSALMKMLEEHGQIIDFWIDKIKSFCFVTYKSVEEAINARNAVHDLIWPPNNRGNPLYTEFVSGEEAKERIKNYGKEPVQTTVTPSSKVSSTEDESHTPPKLDELFRRTTAEPRIYFKPLTIEEVNNKLAISGLPPLGNQAQK